MANRRLEAASWDLVDQDTGEVESLRLETSIIDKLENDQIVADLVNLGSLLKGLQLLQEDLRMELKGRMELDGATEYVGPSGKAELKEFGASYEPTTLDTLLEHLPEAELAEAQALVPEHEETKTVPRRWNVTKLKPFGKRGQAIREIIEGARVVSGHRLEVKGP